MEHWLLEDEFNFYVTQLKVNPDIIVYLRAPPEVCLKRIQERGRPEEKKITLVSNSQFNHIHSSLNVNFYSLYIHFKTGLS